MLELNRHLDIEENQFLMGLSAFLGPNSVPIPLRGQCLRPSQMPQEVVVFMAHLATHGPRLEPVLSDGRTQSQRSVAWFLEGYDRKNPPALSSEVQRLVLDSLGGYI